MKHRMKWCELREYKWNEYLTIAVNCNLSNCKIVEAPKNVFWAILQLLKLRFTAMVTYSFHLYSRSSHHFIQCVICNNFVSLRMVYLQSVTQAYFKKHPSSPNRSRNYDLVTSLDAVPLSYRRLMEARRLNLVHVTNILHTVRIWMSMSVISNLCPEFASIIIDQLFLIQF